MARHLKYMEITITKDNSGQKPVYEVLDELFAGIAKLVNLERLRLTCDNLLCFGATRLAGVCQGLTKLVYLDLSCSKISVTGIFDLSNALGYLEILKELNLSYNDIDADCFEYLVSPICSMKCLEVLHLDGNKLGPKGMQRLASENIACTKLRKLK